MIFCKCHQAGFVSGRHLLGKSRHEKQVWTQKTFLGQTPRADSFASLNLHCKQSPVYCRALANSGPQVLCYRIGVSCYWVLLLPVFDVATVFCVPGSMGFVFCRRVKRYREHGCFLLPGRLFMLPRWCSLLLEWCMLLLPGALCAHAVFSVAGLMLFRYETLARTDEESEVGSRCFVFADQVMVLLT